jgi:predicted alpha/beta hydrolase family esterase
LGGQLTPFSFATFDQLAAIGAIPVTAVMREKDFYRTTPAEEYTAGWPAEVHIMPGEGHFNLDDGHGPFPAALEWVVTGRFDPEGA